MVNNRDGHSMSELRSANLSIMLHDVIPCKLSETLAQHSSLATGMDDHLMYMASEARSAAFSTIPFMP